MTMDMFVDTKIHGFSHKTHNVSIKSTFRWDLNIVDCPTQEIHK